MVRMLANVQQATIRPIIEAAVAKGALVHTDEYDVYARLEEWGYEHNSPLTKSGLADSLWRRGSGDPAWRWGGKASGRPIWS
jgi:hypothetical protein